MRNCGEAKDGRHPGVHYLLTFLLNDATEAGVSADFSVPTWLD
jgi:hypothetical protein